ncbi:MAG: O-antigen ligase domain-containing protein [Marinomonas sp.]
MDASAHHPQTPAERLVARTIECTWLLWLLGALYIVGPVLGWVLAVLACLTLYLSSRDTEAGDTRTLPFIAGLWLAAMAAMLVILWVGHSTNELGAGKTIKSSVGWAKGWALIALFIFAGATLRVRADVIYRAVCRLGLQTLVLVPLFIAAPYVGLPEQLWVSPLKILGGAGAEYFAATLYTIEPGAGTPRWQFFAPWSPAAGMMGVIYVLLSSQEQHRGWRLIGIAAGLALAVLSQSRLALVALIVIVPTVWAIARATKGYVWLIAAPVLLFAGLFGPTLLELVDTAMAEFSAARADSSRVRATLGRIAIERWQNEAFWFGHGTVENGPHLVEYMPIGSHHSWYGLLFVKGLLGAIALAVPLGLTVICLTYRATTLPIARVGLGLSLALVLYSFGENLEILAYLYWPALLIIGSALGTKRAA